MTQKTKLVPVTREPALLPERDADKSPVLECIDLGITFGGLKAVDSFNITIGRTEIAGLIGPNGAGKTTIFNLLTKVYQPTHGTILLNGKDIQGLNTAQINRAGIARTFQNIRLFQNLSVEENIITAMDTQMHYNMAEGILRLPRFWREERVVHERAMELLSIFHMEELADAKAGSLPYGAQRRLEILRAGDESLSAAARRAGGGHEPQRDGGADGEHPLHPRYLQDRGAAHRARYEPRHEHLRGHRRAELRAHHRQGLARRYPEQSRGHRSIPRQEEGGVTMAQILKVDDIQVYYGGIHAVKGVSFEVNEGEVVTLIGANGAGKSTILNTISGLLHPKMGSVLFEDHDLKGVAPHKIVEHGLAQVPEGRHIFQQMTVEENLQMGAYTQPNSTIEPGIADVYERFPRLKERRRQIAGTLSGGEQQMLAMGRALMSKPKLLMLDEPSMGLAPILVEQIFDIIRELHAAGTTILLVEQNAQAALSVADRAYVLETGKISLTGTGAELMASDAVRKAYLGG